MEKARYYHFEKHIEKEFCTGGSVAVIVTYDIKHPEELRKAPRWVKEMVEKGKIDLLRTRKPLDHLDTYSGGKV